MNPGTQLAHYEILSAIGKGGMGEVWKARDTKLGREVAIKTLPAEFAQDTDRLARFEREAKLLASLNHPNIAAIYGLEESEGTRFLVLELVDGDTLADRLKRGAIPVEESLKLALQIAEALEAAHEKGVIHRDLKPANIKVTPDGKVKVLDFGLAKAFAGDESDVNLSNSPTLSMQATQRGIILGTAAYMSPEQAKGLPADKRADVFALGCVLYEMLTGRQVFGAEDVTTILARVVDREPDFTTLPVNLNPKLPEVLDRCLQKDVRRRYHDIADVRLDLENVLADPSGLIVQSTTEIARTTRASRLSRAAAMIVVVAAIAAIAAWTLKPATSLNDASAALEVTRLRLDVSPGQHLSGGVAMEETRDFAMQRPSRPSLAWSPDGRVLVYAASDGETIRLFRRPMDQQQSTSIPGTEGGSQPFFSPDGRSVGFFIDNELKRVPIEGGEVRTITAQDPELRAGITPVQASWTPDDTIVVSVFGDAGGIYEVPANGGDLVRLTEVDPSADERAHLYPQMVGENRVLLFNVANEGFVPSDWTIVAERTSDGERTVIAEGGSHARYLPSGHVVFARNGTLLAVPFDVSLLEVTGAPVIVVEDVMHGEGGANGGLNRGSAQYSVSDTGTLVYAVGGIYPSSVRSLFWVDLNGESERLPLPADRYLWPRFSSDGTRLVYGIGNFGDQQLWVYDIELEVSRPLTNSGENVEPVWSPDGTRLVFYDRGEGQAMFSIASDGSGEPEPIGEDVTGDPSSWSMVNNVLAFLHSPGPGEPQGIWTLQMDGESQPEPFLEAASLWPDFSPDGRWIAYVSAETGRQEVYVRPFPEAAPVERVSPDGGTQPVWSPDGQQLFYTRQNTETDRLEVIVVDVTTEPAFRPSPPRMLFEGPYGGTIPVRSFDVSPDGTRFVMPGLSEDEPQPVTELNIVQNWTQELLERVPVD